MPRVEPCVRGLLTVDGLLQLRARVEHEVIAGVRAGADQRTLRNLVGVIDLVDQRIEHRSAMEARAAMNRVRIAADKSRIRHMC